MVEPGRSNDPENKAGGSIATDRVTQAGPVKGDDPDKKGYHCHPGWGLGLVVTTPPRKKIVFKNTQRCLGRVSQMDDDQAARKRN